MKDIISINFENEIFELRELYLLQSHSLRM